MMQQRIFLKISITFLLFFSSVRGWTQDTTTVLQYLDNAKQATTYETIYTNFEKAYTLAKQLKYTKGIQAALAFMAAVELDRGEAPKALRYGLEELDILVQTGMSARIITVSTTIGDIYAREKLFEEALPYYRRALDHGAPNQLYQKLGDSYAALLKPDTAYIYYAKRLPFIDKQNTNNRINIYHNIVDAYQLAQRYDQALGYNQRILSIMQHAEKPDAELAIIYNNIGYNHNFLNNYQAAINHFEKAYELTAASDHQTLALLQINIGIAYFNLGATSAAIQAFTLAERLLKKIKAAEKSQINHLLSNVYLKSNDLYNALNFNQLAIKNALKHEQPKLLSDAYYTAAQIYADLFEYQTALGFFQKHFELKDSLEQLAAQQQAALFLEREELEAAETEIRSLLVNQEIQELLIQQLELEGDKQLLAINNLKLEANQQEQELALLKKEQEVKESRLNNQQLLAKQTQQQLQLTQQQLLAFQQDQKLMELAQKEKLQQLALDKKEALLKEEAQKNALLQKDNEIQQLDLERQQDYQQFLYGLGGLLLLIMGLIGTGLLYSRRTNRTLAAQKVAIQKEQQKSDDLLLNILPVTTAQELKENGYTAPRKYENTTVLFADFVNFTGLSANMPPEQVVKELNECFKAFDDLMDQYGLEKIKTIGDAYMCVGGLPTPKTTHAEDAAKAALAMMQFIQKRYEAKKAKGELAWQMRVGLHSGPVVAGVVGTKKFVYDIWGDTVNVSSRIESNSIAGKINISHATYQLIQHQFTTTPRGEIQAKNKGGLKMYFLENSPF